MIDPRSVRDHFLPPDRDAFLRAEAGRGRVVVIAPTRAACETIERALSLQIATVLEREHGAEVRALAGSGRGFGIVAGTGTGKTLAIRPIAGAILGAELRVGVVNREREATPETPTWNVVIVTTGIARRWFQDGLIGGNDTLIVDEIHQTSAELELCLALGKRVGCQFIWLSATVDPAFYASYLDSESVLETSVFDPKLAATVRTHAMTPVAFVGPRFVRHVIAERRGVAVFLPTRAEVEQLANELGDRWGGLTTAFYHGGEPIRVIRPFLDGEAPRPFLLAMTAAGQSALNIPGLDTVVISDARFTTVIERGRNVLTRKTLGANEILQMAGRVHGRVAGGEVHILSERRLSFSDLVPEPPEFQLAGDSERVALTAAALGVNLEELELPVPLDRQAYRRAVALMTERGIIRKGRLTDYGRAVEAMPVDRPWAEILVQCDPGMVPFAAVAANVDSLHRMTREETDLRGLVVSGSDHLTCYNIYAEAVNEFGHLGRVFGLDRHVFSEELDLWAEGRGVLVKSIEDVALGMASVYRTLETEIPKRLPIAGDRVLADLADLIARVMPFDLVIDQEQANGQRTRVSRGSVCNPWGAVAGQIRYFAARSGAMRAAIEGTNLPLKLLTRYSGGGGTSVSVRSRGGKRQIQLLRKRVFQGFELDSVRETIPDRFPKEVREDVLRGLVGALLAGATDHPAQRALSRAINRVRNYNAKSTHPKSAEILAAEISAQLLSQFDRNIATYSQFLETPVKAAVSDFVSEQEREEADRLPDWVQVRGRRVPLEYAAEADEPVVRLVLKPGEAKQLRKRDLPQLDRPLRFTVLLGKRAISANSLKKLKADLAEAEAQDSRRKQRYRHRGRRRRR